MASHDTPEAEGTPSRPPQGSAEPVRLLRFCRQGNTESTDFADVNLYADGRRTLAWRSFTGYSDAAVRRWVDRIWPDDLPKGEWTGPGGQPLDPDPQDVADKRGDAL